MIFEKEKKLSVAGFSKISRVRAMSNTPLIEEDTDISDAKALTTNSTRQDFIKATGIEPNWFFRIYRTLNEILFNEDRSYTKFAKQYNVKSFNDMYVLLRDKVKRPMLRDHMEEAWDNYIRLMYMVAYPKLLSKGLFNDPIHAVNFTQRTIYHVLDNLRIMQKVLKIMQYMHDNPQFQNTMLELEKKLVTKNSNMRAV